MNYENYKNTKEYPQKESYTKYKVITVNKTYENLNHEEFQKCKNSLNEKYLVDKVVSDDYEQKIKEYQTENQRIEDLFCQDLKDYYGDFDDYPNGEKIFSSVYSRAYAEGHSGGHYEVAEAYGDLYDFVREILKLTENKTKND